MSQDLAPSARCTRTFELADNALNGGELDRLDRLVEQIASELGADSVCISLLADEQVTVSVAGGLQAHVGRGDRAPFDDTICANALRSSGPLVIDNARADARVSSVTAVEHGLVGAYLGAPLRIADMIVGVLCATDKHARTWTQDEIDWLVGRAGQVADALIQSQQRVLSTPSAAGCGEPTEEFDMPDAPDALTATGADPVAARERLGTVLVTGAGGAAAVTLLRSLTGHARLVAADIDPVAVGLYLVEPQQRRLLPRGDDPRFVDALLATALETGATLVIPTVDSELLPVSVARDRFAAHGIDVLVESAETLDTCLDKHTLMARCAGTVQVPRTLLLDTSVEPEQLRALGEPFIVKPRRGAGGRGFAIVDSLEAALALPRDGSLIAQELLPGDEYSVDVLARPGGGVVAAVPRRRDKVDSGVAVAGRTVADPALIAFATAVANLVGAQTVINVQVKLDNDGRPALLEVNARFPGTMTLTQAAGVDMPLLAVEAARGHRLPDRLDFTEVAVVRHWADIVVPVEQYGQITSNSETRMREPAAGVF